MTLKEKIDSIDYSKISKPETIKQFIAKVEEKAKTSMTEAQALMDGVILKIQEKYPDAITKKIAPEKARVVISKLKKLKNIVPRKADFNKIADQIQSQQPNFTRQQAEELAKLRIEAQIARSTSFNDMIDVLSKSSFYSGRLSTANIDKGRTRDLEKDSNRSSITEADELKMRKKGYTPRKYKRISKAGHKNQYGTTQGGNVYYEYRDNRRDVDSKIRLEKGGMIGKEVEFDYYGESRNGKIIEDLGKYYAVQSGTSQVRVDKDNILSISEPKKGRFLGLFSKGGTLEDFDISSLDDFEKMQYDRLSKMLSKSEALQVIINDVEGDYSQLSPKLSKIAEKQKFNKGGGVEGKSYLITYVNSEGKKKSVWALGKNEEEAIQDGEKRLKLEPLTWTASDVQYLGKYADGGMTKSGRFAKHFKKGGSTQNYTYIPQKNIKALTTNFGNTIKGKDLLDGAYTTRKDIKSEPKMVRYYFEDEPFEYGKGGGVDKFDFGSIIGGGNYLPITNIYPPYVDKDSFVSEKNKFGSISNLSNRLLYERMLESKSKRNMQDYVEEYEKRLNWYAMNFGEDLPDKYTEIDKKKAFKYELGGEVDKFALGDVISSDDTPKVWVGEWSLYNEGRLIGEWVDLSNFDSGAEVMDYIQSLLEKWTKETGQLREEYAVLDYENFPRSLYSENMGEGSFDKVIRAYKFSVENDVPMEVVGQIISEYDIDDLEEWFSERYAGQFDSDTDLAYWYVDEMLGGVENLDSKTQEMYFDYEAFGRDLAINDYRDIDGYYFQTYRKGGMTMKNINRYYKRK